MSDLTEFVQARVDEDEAVAREAAADHGREHWAVGGGGEYVYPDPPPGNSYVATGPWGGGIGRAAAHIARHDPARVLAECEAKQHLLDEALVWGEGCLDVMARYMAEVYADHPDYREEWRP